MDGEVFVGCGDPVLEALEFGIEASGVGFGDLGAFGMSDVSHKTGLQFAQVWGGVLCSCVAKVADLLPKDRIDLFFGEASDMKRWMRPEIGLFGSMSEMVWWISLFGIMGVMVCWIGLFGGMSEMVWWLGFVGCMGRMEECAVVFGVMRGHGEPPWGMWRCCWFVRAM